MKNKLENWESGLGDRMKGHEFPFDPAAMAGFESLLAAENAVAGEATVAGTAETTASGWSSLLAGKFLALLGGIALLAGLFYFGLSSKEEAVASPLPVAPVMETLLPATPEPKPEEADVADTAPASLPYTAPAAAPPSSLQNASTEPSAAPVRNTAPPKPRVGPRPLPTDGMRIPAPRTRRLPPVSPIRVNLPVMEVPVPERELPTVAVTLVPAVKQAP